MGLKKVEYKDKLTIITAENLNDIQNAIIELEKNEAILLKSNYYVTPEAFGALGNGINDDSEAIQKAIDTGFPVMFGDKTYLCKNIITKNIKNVILIGTGTTVLKWNIITTEGLHEAGMISDDDHELVSYAGEGTVQLENIIFDGNGDKITDFPVANAFGLCVFCAREKVEVKNCTFRNCHADGIQVRGTKNNVIFLNCVFENLGLWQPEDGTRNGMTLTRRYFDRGTGTDILNENSITGLVENCVFRNIADECARVDGFSAFSFKNCTFEKIGHFILETGHTTDKTPYVHEIVDCIGKYIGNGLYNSGADGGGVFEYEGKVTVKNSHFSDLAWTLSEAAYKRSSNAYLIDGYTTGIKPDIYVENSHFSSTTRKSELTDRAQGYFLVGRKTFLKNVCINYRYINMNNIFPIEEELKIVDSTITIYSNFPDSFFTTIKEYGRLDLRNSLFYLPQLYEFARCNKKYVSFFIECCELMNKVPTDSEGGSTSTPYILFHMYDSCGKNNFRMLNNIIGFSLSGRMIHYEGDADVISQNGADNMIIQNNRTLYPFCEWGSLFNVEPAWKNIVNNSMGITSLV